MACKKRVHQEDVNLFRKRLNIPTPKADAKFADAMWFGGNRGGMKLMKRLRHYRIKKFRHGL